MIDPLYAAYRLLMHARSWLVKVITRILCVLLPATSPHTYRRMGPCQSLLNAVLVVLAYCTDTPGRLVKTFARDIPVIVPAIAAAMPEGFHQWGWCQALLHSTILLILSFIYHPGQCKQAVSPGIC